MLPARSHAGPRTSGLTPLLAGAALVLATYLVLDRGGLFDPSPSPDPRPVTARGELASFEKTTIRIVEDNSPSVVHITTLFDSGMVQGMSRAGSGSGFVWDKLGHLVTNFHVVRMADPRLWQNRGDGRKAPSIIVSFKDQPALEAQWVGAYPYLDVAVVKIIDPPRNLRPLLVGSSGDLKVGQAVFAIGNPFGLGQTLSTGVVSALERSIITDMDVQLTGLIQVDAAINPGNSGGPLLDSAGRLIGMTTAIVSKSGDSAGIGFAVPVDVINRKLPRLLSGKHALRGGLGIRTGTGGLIRLGRKHGFRYVVPVDVVVQGGGAHAAGIKPLLRRGREIVEGDSIMAIDDKDVDDVNDLHRVLDEYESGATVTVKLARWISANTYQIVGVKVTLKPIPAN